MRFCTDIPVKKQYDLVVCGGGVAGFSAAVSAARRGLKTALIEKNGCLGGVATSGGVYQLLGGRRYEASTGKVTRNAGGIFDEVADTLVARQDAVDPDTIDPENNPHGWFPNFKGGIAFEPEPMKLLLDELCLQAGVDLYFFTHFVQAVKETDRITGVVVHNKSGLLLLETKLVVDATGDADVAFRSGCDTVYGREEDRLTGPSSLEMCIDNVDTARHTEYILGNKEHRFRKLIAELREKGIWRFPYDIHISTRLTQPDVYFINTVRQPYINGTDGDSVTQGMINGRKESMELFRILKQYFPGYENIRLRSIAEMIGIRESRRIVGKYVHTVENAVKGDFIEESIAYSSHGWDLPDPHKPSVQPMEGKNKKPMGGYVYVPYKCMLPEPVRNLIAAGRCISVDRDVLGSARIMGPCMSMGQAAGVASAMCLESKTDYHGVDVAELRRLLLEDGCLLPE